MKSINLSVRLDDLRRTHLELSAKDAVPEAAGNSEAILVVGEVMLQVVLLELLVVWRKSERSAKEWEYRGVYILLVV